MNQNKQQSKYMTFICLDVCMCSKFCYTKAIYKDNLTKISIKLKKQRWLLVACLWLFFFLISSYVYKDMWIMMRFFLFAQCRYQPFILTFGQNAFISVEVTQYFIFSALLWLSLYCTERYGAAGKWKPSRCSTMDLLRVS